MGVSLYTSRVVLSTLGVEDFGIYNVTGGVVAMFGFLNGTLASGTQRFLTFELGKNNFIELKKTFSASLNVHIILSVIILILAETIGLWFLKHKINLPVEREIAAFWVYQFSVFASILSVLQVPYNASIIAHERMNIYAYVSIIDVVLRLAIVYLLLVSGYDKLITYAVLIFIVCVITMTIYRIYCKRQYPECRFGLVSDRALYKSILVFSGWNVFGCGAVVGATQGVNILLNMFFGPAINAARGIAVQVSSALSSFVNNFQTAVNPQIVKLYAAEKTDELHALVFQNAKFSFCLMWLLLLPVSLTLEAILQIWLVEVPEYTALFCRLILIQTLISCMQRPFVMVFHATGKMKIINLTAGSILLSVLPVSYVLLQYGFPCYVPFIIYICATLGEFFFELFFLKKWVNLPVDKLFKTVFIPVIFIMASSFPIAFLANYYMEGVFASLITVSVISVLSVAISVYYIAFTKEMRNIVLSRIKTVICHGKKMD
jgi:O-antigen/teichoic acid export membrane protein